MQKEPECLVWTVPEVTRMLGIERTKTYRLIKKGEIPSIRVGNSIKIPKDAFTEYINARSGEVV